VAVVVSEELITVESEVLGAISILEVSDEDI
jgi:hypothetical protein